MSNLMKLNLQHFAENAANNSSEGQNASGTTENNASNSNSSTDPNASDPNASNSSEDKGANAGKTFTQEELTATATKEKKEGKSSILKLFGVSDEKKAKEEAAAYLAWKEAQKTDEQKAAEEKNKLSEEKTGAEQRALQAESKLSAVLAGVNKDSIDDALAIAMLKVTDEKDLDAVFTEMKEQAKYKGFFEQASSGGTGTGSGVGHGASKPSTGAENIGKRLAEMNKKSATKSSYFKN